MSSTLILFGGTLIVSFVAIAKHRNTEYKITSITSKESINLLGTSFGIALIPSSIITISFASIRALLTFLVDLFFNMFK